MYNTILVPLDGSKRAEKILTHVEELALNTSSKIIFLQAVRLPIIIDYEEDETVLYRKELEEHIKQTKSYLSALKEKFRNKGIEVKTCVMNGSVVKAIIDCAEREDADLIAMTSHGRTGLARTFYGSVAAGVLHQIDRPLKIIRSQGDEWKR
jgi:nucleotide-binding universal stress UspA family protein